MSFITRKSPKQFPRITQIKLQIERDERLKIEFTDHMFSFTYPLVSSVTFPQTLAIFSAYATC